MDADAADYLSLRQLEEALWQPETRFDSERMRKLLAPDFLEFGRSGRVYSRAETLAAPFAQINAVLPLPDFRVRMLADGVAQVTYISAVEQAGVLLHAHRSSIWSQTEAGWLLRFHQGTPTGLV
jgi:hypothetical protein